MEGGAATSVSLRRVEVLQGLAVCHSCEPPLSRDAPLQGLVEGATATPASLNFVGVRQGLPKGGVATPTSLRFTETRLGEAERWQPFLSVWLFRSTGTSADRKRSQPGGHLEL